MSVTRDGCFKQPDVRNDKFCNKKRGIGMGSIAFSDVILLISLSTKREVTVIFTKKCGDNTVDVHVRYQQVGNRAMSKYYMGDYVHALR